MAKKKKGLKQAPLDVDAVLARAKAEREAADPYRSRYRAPWERDEPAEPVIVRRYAGPPVNRFTSARERKAAKAASASATNKRRSDKRKASKKSA